jgi:dihydroneopterin aldolase
MGFIHLENMEFYAFHGHYKEERIVGNKFIVNVTIDADLEKPAKSDNLEDTLNYQKAYQIVKIEMSKKSHLLENIASRILDALYSNFKSIRSAEVKISKLNPPIGGRMNCVSITLTR